MPFKLQLSASVGIGGKNTHKDVSAVQRALNFHILRLTPLRPLVVDGSLGRVPAKSNTVLAIQEFQKRIVNLQKPDGRIDVNGATHKLLNRETKTKAILKNKQAGVAHTLAKQDIAWPLKNNRIRRGLVNHTFGMVRRNKDGSKRPHQGWDLVAVPGTPAYAISDGVVEYVRDSGAYGKQLCLAFQYSGKRYFAFYAHLQGVNVQKGDAVARGEHIALTGRSGNAGSLPLEDQHLHFEIRTVAYAGRGLTGRVSPLGIYGQCPLKTSVVQN